MKTIALEHDKAKSVFNDKYVWSLLVFSLSVRIYLSFFTYVIKNDSVVFIQNAKYFASGDFSSALGHDYHPLYSLIMATLYKGVPDMELSGTIISVLFGTLTVIVFYLIGKSVFDRKVAFVSSVILAFHPYAVRFSAEIISESTYFFFFISAFGLGYFAITKRRFLLFSLTGICSAFAYLTRPEGIGIIIIVVSFCALKGCTRIRVLWGEKLISILILIISFLVFSMPYLVYIKKETGDWRLTKKKDLSHMVGVEAGTRGQNSHISPEKDDAKQWKLSRELTERAASGMTGYPLHLNSILHITKKYIDTFHTVLFIFFIIGVVNWSRVRKEQLFGLYTVTITVFYLFILYRLSITHLTSSGDVFVYPSRRHLMPLVIPAVFCVGIGIYKAGMWTHEKFHNCSFIVGFKELLESTWSVQLIVLLVVISVLLPKTLKPQGFDKIGIKEAGQWVKEHSHKPFPSILSTFARNAYYAGGKHVQMETINNVLVSAQTKKVDYMLLTYEEYIVIEKAILRPIKDKKMVLAYKYPEETPLAKHSVLLYEVLH